LAFFQEKRGFLGPWGLAGPSREGVFYINPSRRGPVAPPEAPGARGPEGAG